MATRHTGGRLDTEAAVIVVHKPLLGSRRQADQPFMFDLLKQKGARMTVALLEEPQPSWARHCWANLRQTLVINYHVNRDPASGDAERDVARGQGEVYGRGAEIRGGCRLRVNCLQPGPQLGGALRALRRGLDRRPVTLAVNDAHIGAFACYTVFLEGTADFGQELGLGFAQNFGTANPLTLRIINNNNITTTIYILPKNWCHLI
ncbi:hypothetical protein B0T21DRAFT_435257 [Apiosordaria backusii]|uniref:Uncharacterized protein n=1 Tax=Apiosordaria backusii TaxID=314023 RepID=A0AA39ZPC8_9PEZI|nr:hypothetical protein B0T21DRAFT_435257 [Apiosordaria backusii]